MVCTFYTVAIQDDAVFYRSPDVAADLLETSDSAGEPGNMPVHSLELQQKYDGRFPYI